MGSFKRSSFSYLYKGKMILVEEWDRDYIGITYDIKEEISGLPEFSHPVQFLGRVNKDRLIKLIKKSSSLQELITLTTSHNILTTTNYELLITPNFNIINQSNLYKEIHSQYSVIQEQREKSQHLSKIFSIENLIREKLIISKEWEIRVLNPNYLVVENIHTSQFEVQFFGTDIIDISKSLFKGITVEGKGMLHGNLLVERINNIYDKSLTLQY